MNDSEAVVSVAGADIQLEGIKPEVLRRIFESSSFTLADVKVWDPAIDVDEMTDLITELVRSG